MIVLDRTRLTGRSVFYTKINRPFRMMLIGIFTNFGRKAFLSSDFVL